tara:strand:- start:398 stop:784 length:387 start_codon:yes stop_codon:yes gene_type:complete
MDFTTYLANRLIKATVGNLSYAAPGKVFLALYTTDPTKSGSSSGEVNQASYSRKEVKFKDPVEGVTTNQDQIDFAVATSDWGNIGWVAVLDAASSGFMLYYTALENPKNILSGDQLRLKVNEIKLQLT